MNKSLHFAAVLRLNRYNVPAVTHCYNVFLQVFKSLSADVALEGILDFVVGYFDFTTNISKLGTRLICYHILGEYGPGYALFQGSVR